MRILADQDIYAVTVRLLASRGHDVLTAAQANLARAGDEALLLHAHEQGRILLTRDRDFGSLVFVKRMAAGVLYLRVAPQTLDAVHRQLLHVLASYEEEMLRTSFTVIEAAMHRVRRKQ